jgi:hypothetical protein
MSIKIKPVSRENLITSLNIHDFGLTVEQLTMLHALIKTNLLRDGVYTAQLQNKDQLMISLDDSHWATVGTLRTVIVSFGEFMPAMDEGDEDGWMVSGTRYFPAYDNGLDDAVMVFMGRLFANPNTVNLPYANIDSWSLEAIEKTYSERPDLVAQAEENFSYKITVLEVGIPA